MASTSYVDIPAGLEQAYRRGLRPGDRFIFPRIVRKDILLSRIKIKGLKLKTYLPILKTFWATMTDMQRADWTAAGAYNNMTGWRFFVAEMSLRFKAGDRTVPTPSIYHQGKVGLIFIPETAGFLQIAQFHPTTYYISAPLRGSKGARTLIQVSEPFHLPFSIGISYKTDLTSEGAEPYARFYARVYSQYQGRNIITILKKEFGLSDDWQIAYETIEQVLGVPTGYDLFIETNDVSGSLWVDNIKAVHDEQNWTRDPRCNDIHQDFTLAFYQVPKNWAAVELPTGAFFESVYELMYP